MTSDKNKNKMVQPERLKNQMNNGDAQLLKVGVRQYKIIYIYNCKRI